MSGGAAERDAEDASARGGAAEVDVVDHAADALQFALFELIDAAFVAEVLVAAGEEEEHVADGAKLEPFEQFGPRRPDPLEELDGRGQQFGSGAWGGHAGILAGRRASAKPSTRIRLTCGGRFARLRMRETGKNRDLLFSEDL